MGEARECWAVVRVLTRGDTGQKFCDPSPFYVRKNAEALARAEAGRHRFMVHVRLKPEGAPRRYASELDRWLWEAGARSLSSLTSPRTPED